MDRELDWSFGAAIAIGMVVVVGLLFWCVYAVTASNNETEVAVVTACVSNGGSWVVDRHDGECWQKNFRGSD